MKPLTRFVAFLVLFIAAVGFTLSYRALYEYGLANGVSPELAWLWPLIIDGFMLVISLSILRASLLQEPTRYLWALAIVAIVVSIIFNIAHAPSTLAGRAVAMIAPLAMFGSFEVFIGQVKRSAERNQLQASYKGLQEQIKTAQAEYSKMQENILKGQETIKANKDEAKRLQAEMKQAQTALSEMQGGDTRSKMITYYLANPRASQENAAKETGVSRARIGQLLDELAQALPIKGYAAQLAARNGAKGE